MWYRILPTVSVLVGTLASAGGQPSDLDAVKAVIGEIEVRIEHREELTAAKDNRPPLKSESWTFQAGGVNPTVR